MREKSKLITSPSQSTSKDEMDVSARFQQRVGVSVGDVRLAQQRSNLKSWVFKIDAIDNKYSCLYTLAWRN